MRACQFTKVGGAPFAVVILASLICQEGYGCRVLPLVLEKAHSAKAPICHGGAIGVEVALVALHEERAMKFVPVVCVAINSK